MSNRIFLLSKNNITVGVAYNQDTNSAVRLLMKSNKASKNKAENYQLTSIDSINNVLEKLDVSTFNNVCRIYVPSIIESEIKSEKYKFILATGKTYKGEDADKNLLEVWQRFSDLMSEKGQYIVFRNIATCYLKDTQVDNPNIDLFRRANDNYARYCKTEIDKIITKDTMDSIPAVV